MKVYLIPSSLKPGEIARVLREGYDAQRLARGFRRLTDDLALDYLIINTHPGLKEETLLSLIIALMMSAWKQGTARRKRGSARCCAARFLPGDA